MRQVGERATWGAVPYYRMQKPHEVLKRNYPEFDYISSNSIKVPDEVLNQTNLILVTRHQEPDDLKAIQDTGIMWGVDVDDYWHLPDNHILSYHYKENKVPQKTEETLKAANFVIASTDILASRVYEFNKNVTVIPNGIDTSDNTWQSNKIKSNRIRFGFTQGTTHIPDLMTINKDVSASLYDDYFYRNAQICLCGFNGSINKESVYIGYERLLTNDLKPLVCLDKSYVKSLLKFREVNSINKPYRRIPATDVNDFGKVHNELDVIVAPLEDHEFNNCKSNIKMLEAVFMDCAFMGSEVSPYKEYMTKENSFSLKEKSFFDWQRYILKNPQSVKDKAAALKNDLKHFELGHITQTRKQFYDGLKT